MEQGDSGVYLQFGHCPAAVPPVIVKDSSGVLVERGVAVQLMERLVFVVDNPRLMKNG